MNYLERMILYIELKENLGDKLFLDKNKEMIS